MCGWVCLCVCVLYARAMASHQRKVVRTAFDSQHLAYDLFKILSLYSLSLPHLARYTFATHTLHTHVCVQTLLKSWKLNSTERHKHPIPHPPSQSLKPLSRKYFLWLVTVFSLLLFVIIWKVCVNKKSWILNKILIFFRQRLRVLFHCMSKTAFYFACK